MPIHISPLDYWSEILRSEDLDVTEENVFIAASCDQKGINFLKGKSELNVRKLSAIKKEKRRNNTKY